VSLSAVAAVTERIGLIATLSTTSNEPYNVARRIAALDHVSHGRAGWNIVTTRSAQAAQNFGLAEAEAAADRYARATEFIDVVLALWDSWDEGAFRGDKTTGMFADTSRIHPIEHTGLYYSVRGALPTTRSPQGRPVLVQAGYSDAGLDFAARYADILFTVQNDFEAAQDFYRNMKARVARLGRDPHKLLILPALPTVIGGTEAEAQARWTYLNDLMPLDASVANLAQRLHLSDDLLELDEHLPFDALPAADALPDVERGWFEYAVGLAVSERLTVRKLISKLGRGATAYAIGAPEQIAARIAHWYTGFACDGFMFNPDVLPAGLETIVEYVVPELRRRGVFRSEYAGHTLREHLGVERVASR
jgi:FMN-dependent oxidoreductase (nitrilotriacetate monooxygenase family)